MKINMFKSKSHNLNCLWKYECGELFSPLESSVVVLIYSLHAAGCQLSWAQNPKPYVSFE